MARGVRVRGRLVAGFVLVALLGLVSSLVSWQSIQELGRALAGQHEKVVVPTTLMFSLSSVFQNFGIGSRDVALATNESDVNRAVSFIEGKKGEMANLLEALSLVLTEQADKDALESFKAKLAEYEADMTQLAALASEKNAQGITTLLKSMRSRGVGVQVAIDTIMGNLEGRTAEQAEKAQGIVLGSTLIALTFIAVSLVVSLLLGVLISASLAKPLYAMGAVASGISQRDLSVELPPALLGRKDEIGELSRSIQTMKSDILDSITGIKTTVHVLTDLGGSLSTSVEDSSQAVRGIQGGVNQIGQQIQDQTAGITETAATTTQILKNISQLDSGIEVQAARVRESRESIERMMGNMESVSTNMNRMSVCFDDLKIAGDDGNVKIGAMTEKIREVSEHSEKLLAANDVVSNLATQTNLLAMNAAIEAAHAGEYGKGFAVVADEIRKLAESSALQSQEISEDIREIRAIIDTIVESSGETGQAFGDIMNQMETLGRVESEIKIAIEAQNAGSQKLQEAIQNIDQITQTVRQGSGEIRMSSQEIATEMDQLLQSSQRLQHSMESIHEASVSIGASSEVVRKVSVDSGEVVGKLAEKVQSYKI